MHVDISKYRQWMSKEKQLQSQEKVKAHILLYMYFNSCNVMLVVCGSQRFSFFFLSPSFSSSLLPSPSPSLSLFLFLLSLSLSLSLSPSLSLYYIVCDYNSIQIVLLFIPNISIVRCLTVIECGMCVQYNTKDLFDVPQLLV